MTRYRTWKGSRGNRLPAGIYPCGSPLHVTMGTANRQETFSNPHIADIVFPLVRDHAATLCGCLMPDHLHWLLADAAEGLEHVRRFKSYSTHRAWRAGHRGPLWQRSFWDTVPRQSEDLVALARYIVANPVRKGLVAEADEYPYQVLYVERLDV